MSEISEKLEALYAELRKYESLAVAFSGGADSTLLLKAAHEALGRRTLAVTARSPLFTDEELIRTVRFCEKENIRHTVFDFKPFAIEGFRENPEDRCYICKKAMLSRIAEIAGDSEIAAVAEGSNLDDENDHRPGARAVAELSVQSPLKAAGLTKAQVRKLSEYLGLPTYNAPPLACLASRFPYGESITEDKLKRVENSERLLRGLGFSQIRVRSCGDTARIETLPDDIPGLVEENTRSEVCKRLTEYGFTYVSLDLQGYSPGNLNRKLKGSGGNNADRR